MHLTPQNFPGHTDSVFKLGMSTLAKEKTLDHSHMHY